MRDFYEYLRAYWNYVSANLGWGKALKFALVWLAGMFVPLAAKTFLELPNWAAMTWMIAWAFLGYVETSSRSNCELKSARPKIGGRSSLFAVTTPTRPDHDCDHDQKN